jgi:hypothetical protein
MPHIRRVATSNESATLEDGSFTRLPSAVQPTDQACATRASRHRHARGPAAPFAPARLPGGH